MNQISLLLFLTFLSFFLFVPITAYGGTEIGPLDTYSKYQDLIITIISVGGGSIVATWLVQYWNKKKERNEKRRKVLDSYFNELKKPVNLMDNFIDKLLIYLSSLDETNGQSNGDKLSKYLAWSYTYEELGYFKDKVPPIKKYTSVIEEKETNYTKDKISDLFKDLQDEADKWIINTNNLSSKQKSEIKKEFKQFEKEFHDIQLKSVEFSISLRQYYTNKTLMLEYHAMFEYMMGSYFIIRKIIEHLEDKKKMLDLVKSSYKKNSNFLHDMMIDFESKLIAGDLQIK
jgi:hypothetical protein